MDRFGGVVDEGLAEYVVIGRGIVAVDIVEVIVQRQPAFHGLLVDVGLDEVFVYIILFKESLVLLDVDDGTMAESLGTSRHGQAVLVADRGAGNLPEPVRIGPVERSGVAGGVFADDVLEL